MEEQANLIHRFALPIKKQYCTPSKTGYREGGGMLANITT